MDGEITKVGIVGLGRWAKVLTRAAAKSRKLEIVSATSRSPETRQAFAREFGIAPASDLAAMLADPSIDGVILTVPNEQHLALAREVAMAGKHVYTEKPIASTLEEGLEIAGLEAKYGVTVTVGHSARLMAGIRQIRAAIDAGELGRLAFIEANFYNERALELTPQTWRWYKHRAPGGPLDGIEALAGRRRSRRPIDDAHQVRRWQDRLCGGVLDVARNICRARLRLQGADALRDRFRHLGHAGEIAPTLDALYPGRQGRLLQAGRAESSGERHVPRRARPVRAKLPQRQEQRAQRRQRQCRARGRLRGAALDRGKRRKRALGRRHRSCAGARRGKGPQCCLADFSPS